MKLSVKPIYWKISPGYGNNISTMESLADTLESIEPLEVPTAPEAAQIAYPDKRTTLLRDPSNYIDSPEEVTQWADMKQRTLTRSVISLALAKFMERGLSLRASCAKLGVKIENVLDWANNDEAFAYQLGIARGLRVFTLEARALNPKITTAQAGVLLRLLARANPEDWGEKLETSASLTIDANLHAVFESVVSRVMTELASTADQSAYEGELVELGRDSGEVRTLESYSVDSAGNLHTELSAQSTDNQHADIPHADIPHTDELAKK